MFTAENLPANRSYVDIDSDFHIRDAHRMPATRTDVSTELAEDATIPLRERQRRTLRAEIQLAALRMFATHGYENVTTEAIAERVGISPSTFFRHVPSKEHLLLGATQRGRAQIVASFRARPNDEDIADSLVDRKSVV